MIKPRGALIALNSQADDCYNLMLDAAFNINANQHYGNDTINKKSARIMRAVLLSHRQAIIRTAFTR